MASTINATPTSSGLISSADNSGVLALQTGGITAVTIDTAQTVSTAGKMLVGSSSNPFNSLLYVTGTPTSNQPIFSAYSQGGANVSGIGLYNDAASVGIWAQSGALTFRNNGSLASGSETMRIDSSGMLLISCTSAPSGGSGGVAITGVQGANFWQSRANTTNNYGHMAYYNPNGFRGEVATNGTNLLFTNASDYRLKDNVAPMSGALAKVALLKPCTYTFKIDGSNGQGFIAHELQEVCPDAVTGTKDAVETVDDVDAEGKVIGTKEVPKYQGIDTSFLVATLTAALQELNAKVDAQALEIQALKGVA